MLDCIFIFLVVQFKFKSLGLNLNWKSLISFQKKMKRLSFPPLFQPSPFSLSFSLSAAQKTSRQPVPRRPVSPLPARSGPAPPPPPGSVSRDERKKKGYFAHGPLPFSLLFKEPPPLSSLFPKETPLHLISTRQPLRYRRFISIRPYLLLRRP